MYRSTGSLTARKRTSSSDGAFNGCIHETEALSGSSAKKWTYDPAACWAETSRNELVMLREAAYELGGSAKSAVSYSCFTTDERLVGPDEVWLYGPDLSEIRGDCAFARIVLFSIQDVGEEDEAYRALQDIEFVKYHVFPKGYMIRALSEDNREQVRVSRDAIRSGISFRNVGFDYIRRFREKKNVRGVRVIFVTAPEADYPAFVHRRARSPTLPFSQHHSGRYTHRLRLVRTARDLRRGRGYA